ncbi:MAG: TonB-dependent receptor [Phenylobacterium sp.]|uniref:TonB-dependent receptor n=1 Tax=Phenylobacterium sp. TaxID=1871053 RepID=UPI0025F0F135|nr:TonB-dependent receptor [Phenylobacterium sp.]MCA6226921.1 TonB-dependent receptor [Phenylobacterium sp.]MCA6232139.1 TonB-dependent receptor [Phenylobacterium sp.]MCA6234889.1 TonB-dependent receptor [Phenylobacterium sp.]MCA6252628.1 TonB-dependent receptor [Phenylobacterium sp.]MCA6259222.1 TonB-dependent receptor [Phenylobacterium sp.]
MKSALITGASALALLLAATAATAAEDAATVEELVVYGKGESRQVQALTVEEIERAAPGSSPIKMVEKLPGVNFQAADAFGAYEWSTRISIRAFNQNQLGFTLDGVPLGDMSYGNHNGLHISRAIATEDLAGVELAQGSGALSVASTSNLGGALKFISRTPSADMGADVALTVGSSSMRRIFLRAETGELPGGGRGSISYADQQADKWKGQGEQNQRQIGLKFVQPIGDFTVTAFYNASERRENDYQDLSLDMLSRLGAKWDNNTGRWAEAVQIARAYQNAANYAGPSPILDGNGCWTGSGANPYPGKVKCVDDAYYDASGLRDDALWALTAAGPVAGIDLTATVYGHTNDGQGIWYTPYVPSPNNNIAGATSQNAPISTRTTEYSIDRRGLILGAGFDLGDHRISAGGWLESNDFTQSRRFYGQNLASPSSSLSFFSGPFFTQWSGDFKTNTRTFYLEDTWTVSDQLKVNFGFKSVRVRSSTVTKIGSPVINGSITSEESFLPQVGFTWALSDDSELFASYSKNMRAFAAARTGLSPFATTQPGFDAIRGRLQPETSQTLEGGWRFRSGGFQGVAALYYVKFDDRLIGTSAGAGIVGNPTILSNAGSVTAQGFEAAGTFELNEDWSLFGSYAYNDSTYDDDIRSAAGVVTQKISGKTTVDSPRHLLNAEVTFDRDGWFAALNVHYVSERYFTYTNDKSVPSTTTADLSFGYRFQGEGLTEGLEIQANVTNLTDESYVSTIGSNGFGYAGDNQTLLTAAPRQAFVTLRKRF